VSLLVTHNRQHPSAEQRFAAQVKAARELSGWTQEALARRLSEALGTELHQTAITRLERGERAIRFNEAANLAQILGLDLGAYSESLQLQSDEDYQAARDRLDDLKRRKQVALTELEAIRARLSDEESGLQRQIRTLDEQCGALAMALADYDAGDHDAGGLVTDVDAEIAEARAELRRAARTEASRLGGDKVDGEH
jgi:transcriptional regulator with XRE-family HTH domain